MSEHDHGHGHEHGHDHEHAHRPLPLSEVALRAAALEALLVEKGLVSTDAIDGVIEHYANDVGPQNGARVVARAWSDPAYHERLLVVVANAPRVHNIIVCTLCSCYPWPVLGLPPSWYKSAPYRARVVVEPRAVLAEFGVVLADDVEVRVWDSTAEVRYLVLPLRPDGSDGCSEAELAALVTRDSMIGAGLPLAPAAV
jgi:nitrile hydratase